MATCDRAEDGRQTEPEQNPMRPVQPCKGNVRLLARQPMEVALQDERLTNEEHEGEQQPEAHHGVHPPKSRHPKPIPKVELPRHVEAAQANDDDRCTGLPDETPLDRFERLQPVLSEIAAPERWLSHRCRHRDAADPDDHGKDVQGARDDDVIHEAPASFGDDMSRPLPQAVRQRHSTRIAQTQFPIIFGKAALLFADE